MSKKSAPLNNRRLQAQPVVRVLFTPDDVLVVEWRETATATPKIYTVPAEVEACLSDLKTQGLLKTAVASVWVPTQSVLLTEVLVPGKRKADWQAALPYALEESLSQPIEQFHVVVYARSQSNVVSCAVVECKKMQLWQARLQPLGLAHAQLLPDCFALPDPNATVNHQAWSVYSYRAYTDEAQTLMCVRTAKLSGLACDQAWFEQISRLPEHQSVAFNRVETPLSSAISVPLLSLSRGDFKAQSAWRAGVVRLRWVGGLLGVMLATALLATHLHTQRLAAQAQHYQSQTQALFKQLFPDVKRVVNLRAQTTSRLKATALMNVQITPMQMLAALQGYFEQTPDVSIKKIALLPVKNGPRLSVQVSAPQAAALQNIVALSQASREGDKIPAIKLTLELKNVTPSSAEGVLYVDAN